MYLLKIRTLKTYQKTGKVTALKQSTDIKYGGSYEKNRRKDKTVITCARGHF